MSSVKFGFGKKFEKHSGELQWGVFKFGEPLRFYFLDNLLSYLPKFVVQNQLCIDIMTAIAIELLQWHKALKELSIYKITGRPGLKYANNDLQLFVSSKHNSDEVAALISQYYEIHQARGTISGIPADIRRVTYDKGAYIHHYGQGQCGWILGKTFPGRNNLNLLSYNSNTYLGLDNMLDIVLKNKSDHSDIDLRKIIRDEFVPLLTNIRFLFTKPHVIMWGEPLSINTTTQIKFGTFRFGEIRDE